MLKSCYVRQSGRTFPKAHPISLSAAGVVSNPLLGVILDFRRFQNLIGHLERNAVVGE